MRSSWFAESVRLLFLLDDGVLLKLSFGATALKKCLMVDMEAQIMRRFASTQLLEHVSYRVEMKTVRC